MTVQAVGTVEPGTASNGLVLGVAGDLAIEAGGRLLAALGADQGTSERMTVGGAVLLSGWNVPVREGNAGGGAVRVLRAQAGGEGSAGRAEIGSSVGAALLVLLVARKLLGFAVAAAFAGGLFFSVGDISTKVATEGGIRVLFVLTLLLGYTAGTALLQIGYQSGGALTVAGLATLLTNALPIAAGTVVLDEPVPPGAYGGVRVLAFAAVTAGAFLLARPAASADSARRL